MEFETFWEQVDEDIYSDTRESNTEEGCKPSVANDSGEKLPTSNMSEVLNHQITLEKRTC